MKNNKLTQTQIDKFLPLSKEIASMEKLLVNRIEYILDTIAKAFGLRLGNFYINDAGEGSFGNVFNILECKKNIDCLTIEYCWPKNWKYEELYGGCGSIDVIEVNGEEIIFEEFLHSFPKSWLTEDFEQELKSIKKLFDLSLLEISQEREQSNKAEQKLILNAKKKLTKSEIKALKIK